MSHPLPTVDPFAVIDPPKLVRCRFCWKMTHYADGFCSGNCKMRFEEQLRDDKRPVGENARCNCGMCKHIDSFKEQA